MNEEYIEVKLLCWVLNQTKTVLESSVVKLNSSIKVFSQNNNKETL